MNARFNKKVLKLRPDLGAVNGFFFIPPVENILCGFVFERTRGIAHAWKNALPLFDRVPFLHMGFGERVPGMFRADSKKLTPEDEAIRFVETIAPYQAEVESLRSLHRFLEFVEQPADAPNINFRRAAALTNVMLGRVEPAQAHLQALFENELIDQLPEFRDDITLVARELSKGIRQAQELLLGWKIETRKRLGLA